MEAWQGRGRGRLQGAVTSMRFDLAALKSGLTDCTNTAWLLPSTTCKPMGRFSFTVVVYGTCCDRAIVSGARRHSGQRDREASGREKQA